MTRPLRNLALSLVLAAACAKAPPPRPKLQQQAPKPPPIHLTVLATNDLHGWIQPHETSVEGLSVRSGGLALFASYVNQVRLKNPGGVVLVDAGDMWQGTLASNLSEGEAVVAAYNALDYDAVAIGNHEFDYGPIGGRSTAIEPGDDPFGALAERVKQAKFPILARNVFQVVDNQRPAWFKNDGTAVVGRRGLKVAFVGLVTPNTPQVTNPVNVQTLRFTPLAAEAKLAVEELHHRGADVVIALVHAGGKCKDLSKPADTSSCDLSGGEIFKMMDELPEGTFDAVVAGHTHANIAHMYRGTPVIESGAYGTRFGTIELYVDPETKKVDQTRTVIAGAIPVCEQAFENGDCDPKKPGKTLAIHKFNDVAMTPDPKIAQVLDPYLARVASEQKRELGVTVAKTLGRDSSGESALGDALADAVRAMEKSDVALLNSGGLRADLTAGPLTYGSLYEVFPFDNTIATLTLTGQEITDLLAALLGSGHGVPQTSGLKFKATVCGPRVTIEELKLANGKALDKKKEYKLTTSDFLALGGDGTGVVLEKIPPTRKELGQKRPANMRDALADYFAKKGGTLDAKVDGRMVLSRGTDPSCGPRAEAHAH